MKKLVKVLLLVILGVMFFSCTKKESVETKNVQKMNEKYVKLTQDFYKEYFAELQNFDDNFEERIEKVKKKYMTDAMAKELKVRSMEDSADAVLLTQDETGMLDALSVLPANTEDAVVVVIEIPNDLNNEKRVFNIHFIEKDGKTLIDTYDTILVTKDADGKDEERITKTKWANKPDFSENDEKEMDDILAKYESLAAEGYIG